MQGSASSRGRVRQGCRRGVAGPLSFLCTHLRGVDKSMMRGGWVGEGGRGPSGAGDGVRGGNGLDGRCGGEGETAQLLAGGQAVPRGTVTWAHWNGSSWPWAEVTFSRREPEQAVAGQTREEGQEGGA